MESSGSKARAPNSLFCGPRKSFRRLKGFNFHDAGIAGHPAGIPGKFSEIWAQDDVVLKDATVLRTACQKPLPSRFVAECHGKLVSRQLLGAHRHFSHPALGSAKVSPFDGRHTLKCGPAQLRGHARHSRGLPVKIDYVGLHAYPFMPPT